jgi:O-antigen ligase
MQGMFLCFSLALVINLFFVAGGSVSLAQYSTKLVDIGYEGYFTGKNYLGQCAVVGLLLSLYAARRTGWRRAVAGFIAVLSVALIFLSNSKTALGLALVCPLIAQVSVIARKAAGTSPAIVVLIIPLTYYAISSVSRYDMTWMAYLLYHDPTLTGRTIIWDFVHSEIARRPVMGWGYQSFWLVPNSPALVEAPGWVKMMPNGHNGYIDTMLEMGYVGLVLLLGTVFASLHAAGRIVDRDPARGRLVLSLLLFVICYNYFESLWMRGFEFLWLVFLIAAADAGRYWNSAIAIGSAKPAVAAGHPASQAVPARLGSGFP